MEGLGVAAGVIAVVQLTELALKLAHKHVGLGPSRYDKTELLSISRALYAFNGMLQTLQTHLRINEEDEARLQTLNHLKEPLNQCKEALELLSDQLKDPTFIRKHIVGERFDRKLKKALSIIEDARKLIELTLLSDQHVIISAVEQYLRAVAEDVRDVHTTLNEIEDRTREWHQQFQELKLSREQDKVIQWLQYADPSTNHNTACEMREPLTGNWFLQSDDFAAWKQEPKQLLWLHGIPGCGKTVLSSTVIEHIKTICRKDSQCQYIFYYFDFSDSKKQEVVGLLRSALAQLASRNLETLREVENLYGRNDRGKQQPDKKNLLSILLSVLRSPLRTYLIIDALDECSQREELLKVLSSIYRQCSEHVNILVTSRKEYDIELAFDSLASSSIGIQQSVVDADIRIHVKTCLVEDAKLRRWPLAVKKEMEDALVRGAQGMFRWVVCQLVVLRNCLRLPALRQRLKELPETLDKTYDQILLCIPENCHHEAHTVLQWLAYSRRPMSLAEVAEAITVDRDNQFFDTENRMFDVFSILSICSSLVTLSEKKAALKNGQTEEMRELRLAHYSVKEYLVSRRIQESEASKFAIKETEAHEYMGEVCLIYLHYFNNSDSLYTDVWVDYPFLQYAAESWYGHRQAVSDSSSKIVDLSAALFDIKRGFQFINWLRLHDPEFPHRGIDLGRGIEAIAAPLYYASILGILEAVERLLAAGADVDATTTSLRRTALQAASRRGRLEVVKRLLAAGADVDAVANDGYGMTALQTASGRGHLEVVESLLAAGASVNTATVSDGLTALQAASLGGHLGVVDRLLAVSADVNAAATHNYGQTALQAASRGGHLEVVEKLLAAGADVNAAAPDYGGWLALQAASENGYLGVVERLLAAGANVDAATHGSYRQTALQAASGDGHHKIVERLLAAGADVNADTNSRWTALQAASERGHLEVVEMLLLAGADVNAIPTDRKGQTALQGASSGGHLEIVERLLAAGANVNAATHGSYRQTALQAASGDGHHKVVEKLLAAGADVNADTDFRWTALQAASERGHLEVMEMLLLAGADVNAIPTDRKGQTALQGASSGGHLEIVERLLAAGADANAAPTSRYGLTALQAASRGGHFEIVGRLLAAGADVNGAALTSDGLTALEAATLGGHPKVVEMLLAAGANPTTGDSSRTTPQAAPWGSNLKAMGGHSNPTVRSPSQPPTPSPSTTETLIPRL
ncbi:MAG: hypothetical protein M1839_003233 [Geoglossum umbratile]|nr:MAG: hypothetical protein M1839_003233 [Geoglossum umbratile]